MTRFTVAPVIALAAVAIGASATTFGFGPARAPSARG
jgi:hypothetical protein